MELTILTPGQTVFEGKITRVNLPGVNGSFEVLENHAPLVSSLIEGAITVTTANNTEEVFESTSNGFVEVLADKVSVLLESVKK